ncbi:MAG: hypothetical protein ABSF98_30190 [Bryobacteraceae bacterium]
MKNAYDVDPGFGAAAVDQKMSRFLNAACGASGAATAEVQLKYR